jgi:hypothetical protein
VGNLRLVAQVFPAALRESQLKVTILLKFAKTAAKSRAGFNEWQTVRNTLGFWRKVRSLLYAVQGTGRALENQF